MPGVVAISTVVVEHPELVAQRSSATPKSSPRTRHREL